jgi:hypothetical protein
MFKTLRISLAFVMVVTLTSAVPPFKASTNSQKASINSTKVSINDVINMSPKQYGDMIGEKLSLKERIVFSMLKDELKKSEVDKTETIDLNAAMAESNSEFNLGGFLAGLFLGLIGVGLVHIFSRDSNVRRSSWKGFGAWIILILVLALI